ncbi:MAG: 2-hydroxyglutaryl-CoA dehydratase [Chloroflexi bacterium]|nr:2-hydroxyglutaryl-CoA dehydratase [Chloroflexota bacterium]
MYFAGIDIGSTMTKVAIINDGVVSSVIGPTGPEHRRLANKVMESALAQAGIPFGGVTYVIATGYGRVNVPFADRQVTEISCHARGVSSLFPSARTVIDIGGQDCKAIRVLPNGRVKEFVMNDKCAAGTGRFLEVVAEKLGLKLEELGEMSLRAPVAVKISSTCTVFAEQEIVSHLATGAGPESIVAGVNQAIAHRIGAMVDRMGLEKDVVITGGGAKNIGLVKALESRLGCPLRVPSEPLLTGCIGAALLGKDYVLQARQRGQTLPTKERKLESAVSLYQ